MEALVKGFNAACILICVLLLLSILFAGIKRSMDDSVPGAEHREMVRKWNNAVNEGARLEHECMRYRAVLIQHNLAEWRSPKPGEPATEFHLIDEQKEQE